MPYISVDCCGNEFEVTPCCSTPIVLQHVVAENFISFTAFGDCIEDLVLYVDGAPSITLTPGIPTKVFPADCTPHEYYLSSCGETTEPVELSLACNLEFFYVYDVNINTLLFTLNWNMPCVGGSVNLDWRVLGGSFTEEVGIPNPYTQVLDCNTWYEFRLHWIGPCNDVFSDIILVQTPQCPCNAGITELFKIVGDCDRCVDILLTGVVPPTTVDIYKRPSSFPTFSFVGSWSSNPFTDCNVTKLEDYVYKLVYKGLNCAEVSTETDVTVTYESCCQSCIVSLVDHETYVEVIFNGECCPGTTQRVYRSDGVNPEVDLGPYTVPFYDTSIEFGTTYTYRVETTGECNTSSCSDDITTQCLLIINSNTGDQDLGTIPPSIFVVTFNITVPDCCVPGTLFFNDTSPFIVLGTASTPLIAGTNPYIVAGNIVGAPLGPGAGSVFITASCPFTTASSVNDTVLISWDQT